MFRQVKSCAPPPPPPRSVWSLNYNIPFYHCKPLFLGLVSLVMASSVSTWVNREHSRLYLLLLSRLRLLLPWQQYGPQIQNHICMVPKAKTTFFWFFGLSIIPVLCLHAGSSLFLNHCEGFLYAATKWTVLGEILQFCHLMFPCPLSTVQCP